MNRIDIIKERLQKQFAPQKLEVIDDSAEHVGHAGAEGGAGHYTIIISAESFKNKSRVDAHREIYQVLDDLIPKEIHALRIRIIE
jgi:BolA protein